MIDSISSSGKRALAIIYLIGASYSGLFLLMDGFHMLETHHAYIWKKPFMILSFLALIIGAVVVFYWGGFFNDESQEEIPLEAIVRPDQSAELTDNDEPRFSENELAAFVRDYEADRYLDSTENEQLISAFCRKVEAWQAVMYLKNESGKYQLQAAFALTDSVEEIIEAGEGLTGQVIATKRPIAINDISEDFLKIKSGLGESRPAQLIIVPVLDDEKVVAVIELAVFINYTELEQKIIMNVTGALAQRMLKNLLKNTSL